MKQTKLAVGQRYRVIKDCLGNVKPGTIITVNKLNEFSNIIFFDEHEYRWQIENGDKLELIKPKSKKELTTKDVEILTCGGGAGKTKKVSVPFNVIKIDSSNPSSVRLTPDFESITPKKVKKWKYSREEIVNLLIANPILSSTKSFIEMRDILLATQPQPIKEEIHKCKDCGFETNDWDTYVQHFYTDKCQVKQEESKDIKKVKKVMFNYSNNPLERIGVIEDKLNEVIDTLNSLTKRNIK